MPIELRYNAVDGKGKLALFLDYDQYKPPLRYMKVEEAYELVRMEAVRLKERFGLGRAVILRSSGGWMVRFPDARLTREEMESILYASPYVDRGFRYYSVEKGFQTLRTSKKVIVVENKGKRVGRRVEGSAPQIWEVI